MICRVVLILLTNKINRFFGLKLREPLFVALMSGISCYRLFSKRLIVHNKGQNCIALVKCVLQIT